MGKSTKKRGRPGIKPYINRLIASAVLREQDKPMDARLPTKVLADEIRKQISRTGEQPPELSTLEKKISQIKSNLADKSDPLDEPWTILSLANVEHNIPPEALPAVIKTQADAIRSGRGFTVREALWVGRFYCIYKGTKFEFESGAGVVEITAENYTRVERLCEVFRDTGKLPDEETSSLMLRYDDTLVYYNMTGDREPQISLIKEIRRNPELSDWFFEDEEDQEDVHLGDKEFEEKFKKHLKSLRQELGKKEAKNERKHKAKKQK